MIAILRIIPINMKTANEFIEANHRHHKKVQGCKFTIGAVDGQGGLRGVAVVGRPVSRYLDDGYTAEVTRLCTDGAFNACSLLYAASARAAKAMGYVKIITYILESEDGASLRASSWQYGGIRGGGNWSRKSRPRKDESPVCKKKLYFKLLQQENIVYVKRPVEQLPGVLHEKG